MDSEGSSDQGARFQFIDISSSNARKEARAHVMREFMRQKREEQPDAQKATKRVRKRTKKSAEASGAAKRNRVQDTREEKRESSSSEGGSDSSGSAPQEPTASEGSSHPGGDIVLVRRPSMRLTTSGSRSNSPQSMVDANRRDPFQSLPMWLDEEDCPLVDHCKLSQSRTH